MIFKLICLFTFPVFATVKVTTTLPDLAWLVKAVGQKEVEVEALLSEKDNPHYVEAVPLFIQRAAEADLVVSAGLELESAWLPKILERTGKASIQVGGINYLELGTVVSVLEKPSGPVDRSMGDVHPSGNPHFWLSPLQFSSTVPLVVENLSRLVPASKTEFEKNGKKLQKTFTEIYKRNKGKLKNKVKVLEYHREFTYFLKDYGFENTGSLEEKPGFPPSLGHILKLANFAKASQVKFLLASLWAPESDLKKFKELSQIPYLKFRSSLKKDEDYGAFQDSLVSELLKL